VGRCRALFDYDAGDETELSFRTGDVIIVLQKDPSGKKDMQYLNFSVIELRVIDH
jgi:hypothetical protein